MNTKITSLPILPILALIILSIAGSVNAQECGIDRWRIKTIRDPIAKQINWKAVKSSIADQIGLERGFDKGWKTLARQQDESQLYKITCTLVELGKEDDNDYHLVIKDPKTGKTMIAEIPDPDCKELSNTKLAPKYRQAREVLKKVYGEPGAIVKVKPMKITIWGIGFWEKMNHGTGHSTNGREIHPVVGIE
ncbi:MAG: hypothetical protein JSS75_05940 [Bacteroidetes bacterium]|nr:hypothetical protein [Bacteroidota bacterium]